MSNTEFKNNIGSALEDELGISDELSLGKDLEIIEPKKITDLSVPNSIKEEDILSDYTIARESLHHSIEQTGEAIKLAVKLLQEDPSDKNIFAYSELIKTQAASTEKLFNLHVKIAKEMSRIKKAKDEEKQEEAVNIEDILGGAEDVS